MWRIIFAKQRKKYNLILVSSLEENLLAKAKIQIVKTLDAAMQLAHSKGQVYRTVYVMPHAANTLPRVK